MDTELTDREGNNEWFMSQVTGAALAVHYNVKSNSIRKA